MGYIYSSETNSFYPKELEESYRASDSWPDKYVDVSEEEHARLIAGLSEGKSIVPGDKGYPRLTTVSLYSQEDQVQYAKYERDGRANKAAQSIMSIQLRQNVGRVLTSEEKVKLKGVLDYLDALDSLDLSTAPDIKWPAKPV